MPKTADLLEEIAALKKALLIAADARDKRKDERIAQLEKLVAAFSRQVLGREVEKAIRTSSNWRWRASKPRWR